MEVGGIAFLKCAIWQALLFGAPVPSLDQIARNIDTQNVRTEFRRGYCRRAIAAAEIEHLESLRDVDATDERFTAFTHGVRDAREVAFFPEHLIWIRGSIHIPCPLIRPIS